MNSPKKTKTTLWLLLGLSVITSSGCSTLSNEPVVINVKPKVEPLSKPILQAMQPNSTELLSRADGWLQSSQQLLDSVMNNSEQ